MRCTVCEKDKEINQFQTYWHSTQNKMRQRKQCTECYYNHRLKRKDPEKYYQNSPDYHKCNTCNDWKLIKEFYTSNGEIYSNRCRVCTKKIDTEKRVAKLIENCGSEKVKQKPNTYSDKYQKECTFQMMELLGYTFDVPTGIWVKPGYKEIKDGKPYFPTIVGTGRIARKMTTTILDRIIEYKSKGWNYEQIALELGMSDTTVYKHYKRWKNLSK
jgi:hypothetical protein